MAGLRGWFLAEEGRRSQAEELRTHARRAIPSRLRAVHTIHERRIQRSDRVADWRALGRWFALCPDDRGAHQLWRAAFALAPARHLQVTSETLDIWDQQASPASMSWQDAPPLHISPRLRRTGSYALRGRPTTVIDRSAERRWLACRAAEQANQIAAARQRLLTQGSIPLSSFGELGLDAFDLLLELLGEALARRRRGQTVEATSFDGATIVRLTPLASDGEAVIGTPWGTLRGPVLRVEILAAGAVS